MATWGVALCCHAAATSKSGIYAARFFLGLVRFSELHKNFAVLMLLSQAEAGMFPGVILQMTYWYRPDEMSIRLLYFCEHRYPRCLCCTLIDVDRYLRKRIRHLQWDICVCVRYCVRLRRPIRMAMVCKHALFSRLMLTRSSRLFLFEGLVTIVYAVVIWFCLPDCKLFYSTYPQRSLLIYPSVPPTARWLSDKEKAFTQARLPPNAPLEKELNFRWREIVSSLKDRRLWMFTAIWATQTVGTQGSRFYQSTVIANLGFT